MHEIYTMHPLSSHEVSPVTDECCVPHMELAQAYVCPQRLDGLFSPEEGLRAGTIFPELSQPYEGRPGIGLPVCRSNAHKNAPPLTEREALLKQITILDFMTLDLQLFLNTHPQNAEALEMYNVCAQNAAAAKRIYEQQFSSLVGFRSENPREWVWQAEPWPWQAAHNFAFAQEGGQ